jgi:guanylate kinase
VAARLTVLSGPSAAGKGTVAARLRELVPDLWVSVSCTTRPPRPGEADGVQYHFVTRERFREMIDAGELLEYGEHFGNLYGTPREPVLQHLRADIPTLLEIELNGARQVRATMPDACFVFLAPPSAEELVRRLAERGTETPAQQRERLARAEAEMAAASEFDHVVINDDVERAAAEVAELATARA